MFYTNHTGFSSLCPLSVSVNLAVKHAIQLLVKVLQNIETHANPLSNVSSNPLFTKCQIRKHQEIQENTDKQNSKTSTEDRKTKNKRIPHTHFLQNVCLNINVIAKT